MIQIHCCIWITNVLSSVSDKVFHIFFKPQTVKRMKIGYNYTGCQLVEHRSSWKGPDTINVSSFGKTSNGYILIQEAEAHSYSNRTDMKSLFQRLIDNEKNSTIMLKEQKSFLNQFQEMLTT